MAVESSAGHHRSRRIPLSFATIAAVAILLFSSVSALARSTPLNHHFSGSVKKETGGEAAMRAFLNRRRLLGPGSSPPTCRSKCGRCRPCRPVHVPIQPGLSTPLEYYPEAWRCKCGDKLFMP